MSLNLSESLHKSALSNIRCYEGTDPQNIKTLLSSGPFDGILFKFLDALGVREGKSYGYSLVHSRSKSTDGVYSSLKKDMLIFYPPIPFKPSDVFYSENSKMILDEDPHSSILELVTKCFHGGNIYMRDWDGVRKELMDGAELWALFKYKSLDAHYSKEDGKINNRQSLIVKILNMNNIIDDCILFERDRARDEGDDAVKLIFVKKAIEGGLHRANEIISAVAHMAHQTLKGTALAEENRELNQNNLLKERHATKIDSDSMSWVVQLSICPTGNIYFPKSTYDAKRIIAIGHLLNTNWITITSEHDIPDKDELNLLFVPEVI